MNTATSRYKIIRESSVKKNFIYSTAYQVLNVLAPFITAPYVSRILGVEGIGVQSYTTSIQQYFLIFATLGTISYGSREISMNRDDTYKRSKLFWEIELMVIGTTTIVLLGWLGLCLVSSKYRIYYLVLTIGIVAAAFDISWFFEGMEQFKLMAVRNSIFKILSIACLFVFIKSKDDLLLYIFITTTLTLFSNCSLWPYMKRYLVKIDPKQLEFKRHFRETLIYFLPTIASSVYTVLDKTLLGMITKDVVQNGYYQQAEKVINLARSLVFTAINSVVGVRNTYLFAEKKFEEIHQRIETSLNFIFFMGCGCCFGIMGVAKTFVPLFFGDGYNPVVGLLYIFSPIIIIIGISNCLGSQYYIPCGRRKESTYYLIVGAVSNLGLNLLLIPRYGAVGAAVASTIAEMIISILYVRNSNSYGKMSLLIKTGTKKLIAAFLMFILVYSMNRLGINALILLALQAVAGVGVYLMVLLILKDEWTTKTFRYIFEKLMKRAH